MSKTIRLGDFGPEVKTVQKCLHLIPDGIFGPLTEEAVKAFQRENNLGVDGIVGPETMKAMGIYKKPARNIDEIIIHCTATPEGMDYSVDQIRLDHLRRGFSDIGYHYVIYRDGSIHKGRDTALSGAHCTGHNSRSIGVCYVGGCPPKSDPDWQHKAKDTRTPEQKAALRQLVSDLQEEYPGATVHGHYEFANKHCPSFNICEL